MYVWQLCYSVMVKMLGLIRYRLNKYCQWFNDCCVAPHHSTLRIIITQTYCCGYIHKFTWFMWFNYSYSKVYLHRHWGNQMTTSVPMRIWVKLNHIKLWEPCAYILRNNVQYNHVVLLNYIYHERLVEPKSINPSLAPDTNPPSPQNDQQSADLPPAWLNSDNYSKCPPTDLVLTHWGLVMPYGIGDLGQHWFR